MVDDDVARDTPSGVLVRGPELLSRLPEEQAGALWRLDRNGRQLDANMVRLTAGARVGASVEPDLDVLLYVTGGGGRLETDGEPHDLRPGDVVWLSRGSRRSLAAGDNGLVYLSAHRRRPGLTVQALLSSGAGEAPCMLDRVCPACGRLAAERDARFCSRCGDPLPER